MKNYLFTSILVLCFAAGFGQNSSDEMEIRKLNEAFDKAIQNSDVAFYEQLLADDYVSYGPDGTVKTRKQVLEEVKKQKESPSYRISKIGSEDVDVKISGDLAVVTAKWNATTHAMEDDEPHQDTGHYISVFEKRNGSWQLISEMGSEKPHTPEELEPSLMKASKKYDESLKKRDREAFDKLLAEDYQSTDPSGKVSNREEDIAGMFDLELKLEGITTEEKKFRVYKNSAVETGKYRVTGSYKGESFTESGRYTTTWIYKDGKWQIVADHTSSIDVKE